VYSPLLTFSRLPTPAPLYVLDALTPDFDCAELGGSYLFATLVAFAATFLAPATNAFLAAVAAFAFSSDAFFLASLPTAFTK
jgi:hypothetical protein